MNIANSKKKMVETVEKRLPDFVEMIKTTNNETIILHQDAFAADYQDEEFGLLGMAIKYAGLHSREVLIVSNEKSSSIIMTKVNKNTRAGEGKIISCPNCKTPVMVYHFAWEAVKCQNCGKMVDKYDWNISARKKK